MCCNIFCLTAFFNISCDQQEFTPILDVHADFMHLVDSFALEAFRRGHLVEVDNLIMHYDRDLASDVCGQCNSLSSSSELQKIVKINQNNICWDHQEELEALIFHELGHCYLGREHTTDTLPNGDPKSLMVAGNLTLFAPCKYVFGPLDCNQLHKRTYYLDELFDPSTPVPEWAK